MARKGDRDTEQSLVQEMALTEQEIARRKEFLGLTDEDVQQLVASNELAARCATDINEAFYRHLLSFAEGRAFFTDPAMLAYVKRKQKEYFLQLTEGRYGAEYAEDRLKIGAIHERAGLPVKLYLAMYNFYLQAIADRLLQEYPQEVDRAFRIFLSFVKLVFLDVSLAVDTYVQKRERTVRRQEGVLRELSTPVLQLREGLLILPIIGVIDAARGLQLTEQLLRAIRANRARVVVMDVTGVPVVDSRVANHLVQTVQASRLMGATVIVTGLSPEIAQTLVTLGLDLSMMRTVGDLQTGIAEAERLLGYKVTKTEPGELVGTRRNS